MRRALVLAVLVMVYFGWFEFRQRWSEEPAPVPSELPVKGTVTMIDIGARQCIPCQMMEPILKELEKEYQGLAAIVFIDVNKNVAEGHKYRIRSIPTQIFYDREGKEVFRHEGFLDKASIVAQLEQLGVKKQ
jgi:thioredoxin 1